MNILIVDIGNTQSKIVTSRDGALASEVKVVPHDETVATALSIACETRCQGCLVSSVAAGAEAMVDDLRSGGLKTLLLTADLRFRFSIAYSTPHTLGTDRIAAIAGVVAKHGLCDAMVIDAGSAITFDYLTADGVYLGGAISPGIRMRFRALHEFTARLPECSENDFHNSVVGTDTRSAIAAGVIGGIRAEVDSLIRKARAERPDTMVFITGGDYSRFELSTEISIFAAPKLVLEGLACIAEDNLDRIINS